MHCALFQEFIENIFKFSADLGMQNESTVKSGIFPRRRFVTCFLYLAEYSVKNFITTRQYLVNLTCNCWFRMCTQFHQKLVSYKCMLFVDCLVVLWEYFVNWARATKFQFFFLKYFSSWKLCQMSCLPHNCCCNVTWNIKLLKFN